MGNFNKIIGAALVYLLISISNSYSKEFDIFDYTLEKKQIADLQKSLPKSNFLHGQFEQIKTLHGVNRKFIAKGDFTFDKKAQYLEWKLKEPYISDLIFTKDKLAKISSRNEDLIASQNQPIFGEISNIFQSIFSGDFIKLREYFEVYFFRDNSGWIMGLKPKSQLIQNVINAIILKGNNHNIQEVLLLEAYGDETLIKFRNVNAR